MITEPTNEQRAAWAEEALVVFMKRTKTDDCDAVADLICDLAHLCNALPKQYGSMKEAIKHGMGNYRDEVAEAKRNRWQCPDLSR